MNLQEVCILWLRRILDSGCPGDERYLMASPVVVFSGKQLGSPFTERSDHIHSVAPRPLLDFLLLSGVLYSTGSTPYPGAIALHILSSDKGRKAFTQRFYPFTPTLLPTHPPQPRFRWLSSQAEVFSNVERVKLLEAVGDPLDFIPNPLIRLGNRSSQATMAPCRARRF